jgi:LVIVD repeat
MIDIRDHGGQFGGGKSKKWFFDHSHYKMPVDYIKKPTYLITPTNGIAKRGWKKNNGQYQFLMWKNSSNWAFFTLDEYLNQLSVWGEVDYSSSWPFYTDIGYSKKYNRIIRLQGTGGAYYIKVHNADDMTEIASKYINNFSSFAQHCLHIDDENDRFYFIWGGTLYCYKLSTFNDSSNPLWSMTLPWQPWFTKIYGNLLFIQDGNPSRGVRVYDISNPASPILKVSVTDSADFPIGMMATDGTHLYYLSSAGTGTLRKYRISDGAFIGSANLGVPLNNSRAVPITSMQLAHSELVNGYIIIMTNDGFMAVDPNTLTIKKEIKILESGVDDAVFYTAMNLRRKDYFFPYLNPNTGEFIADVHIAYFNGSGYTVSGMRLYKGYLRY